MDQRFIIILKILWSGLVFYFCKMETVILNVGNLYIRPLFSQNINDRFDELRDINQNINKKAYLAAVSTYKEYIKSVWDVRKVCLHPDDLMREHETAKCRALLAFRPNRACVVGFDINDADEAKLSEILFRHFTELREMNDSANKSAIQAAFNEYSTRMENDCRPTLWWLLIVPIVVYLIEKPKYHEAAKQAALEVFYGKRRNSGYHASDTYLDNLNEMMEAAYSSY